MTISIKPTASGSTIEQDGSTVLSIESDRSVDVDSGTLHVNATNNRVGIGTSNPVAKFDLVDGNSKFLMYENVGNAELKIISNTGADGALYFGDLVDNVRVGIRLDTSANALVFAGYNNTERMRMDSSGNVLVGKTANNFANIGFEALSDGRVSMTSNSEVLVVNRIVDGGLVSFRQGNTQEGTISVSGTTVSYNGGHLARFTQLTNSTKDETILKGTVLSNLDDMCVYVNAETGEAVDNEQLNKVKVSDVEGDPNVAGVHVSWIYDEQHDVEEINMGMTGDMIIRIAQGVTVNRGDLLMSAGDGTAKPQGDDIVRSKTIAKVTSTSVTCTYEDGSYCVPCVLMAC